MSITIPGQPLGKERARVIHTEHGGSLSYTPEQTVHAQDRIAQAVNSRLNWRVPDANSSFSLQCVFYMGDWRRRDGDNCEKLIWDALKGVVWADDWQILEWSGRKDYTDMTHPRSEIRIYRIMPA